MSVLFLHVLLLVTTYGLSGGDDEKELSIKDIYKNKHITLLKVYSTMCGTCKMFEPEWLKLKKHLHGKLRIVEVDIDKSSAAKFAANIGVLDEDEGVPNIRLYAYDRNDYMTFLHGAVGFADELYPKIIDAAEKNGFLDSTGVYTKGSPPQPLQNFSNVILLAAFSVVMLCLVLSYGMPGKQRRAL